MKITEPDIIQTMLSLYRDINKPWPKHQIDYLGLIAPNELLRIKQKNIDVFDSISITCYLENDLRFGNKYIRTNVELYPYDEREKIIEYLVDILEKVLPTNRLNVNLVVSPQSEGLSILRRVRPKDLITKKKEGNIITKLLKKLKGKKEEEKHASTIPQAEEETKKPIINLQEEKERRHKPNC